MKIYCYKTLMTCIPRFLKKNFSLWHHWGCQRPFLFLWYECYLTTIPVEPKILGESVLLCQRPFPYLWYECCLIYFKKSFITCIPGFLNIFFQPLTSWRLSEAVSVSLIWMLSNLLLQKFYDMYTRVLKYFLSASDIMKVVRGRFRIFDMNAV